MTAPTGPDNGKAVTPGKTSMVKVLGICCLPWIIPSWAYLGGFHEIGWLIVVGAPLFTAFLLAIARPQWVLVKGEVRLPRFPFRTLRIPVSHIVRMQGFLSKPGTGKEWAQYDLVLLDGARAMVARQYVGTAGVDRIRMTMASAKQRSGAVLLAEQLGISFAEDDDVLSYLPRDLQPVGSPADSDGRGIRALSEMK